MEKEYTKEKKKLNSISNKSNGNQTKKEYQP